MSFDRGKLHEAIAAVCPIEGVRIGRVDERTSWGFVAAPEATPEQLQAALDVLAQYDPDAPTIDGVRADYPDGWGLVRCSNATPNLVLRFDANDQSALTRIQETFRAQMLALEPGLVLPF